MRKKFLDSEKNKTELHLPGYHFCGPGTKVFTRLTSNSYSGKGINPLDEACMIHDIEYMKYAGNDQKLRQADEKLRQAAHKIGGLAGVLVDKVFFFKQLAEDIGFWSPSSFARRLGDKLSIKEQNQLGNILYETYVNKDSRLNLDDEIENMQIIK